MPRDNPRLLEILCVNGEFESHLGHQENMQVIVWFGGGLKGLTPPIAESETFL